jgi:hypothetical protein
LYSLRHYRTDSYRLTETPANVTYHTPRSESQSPEIETPEDVLLVLSRESFSDTSASNFTGSETVPAELPLSFNDRDVSQWDGNIRNLSTHFSKDIITPKSRPDAVNGYHLYKTTILPDMALPKMSNHREGIQISGEYGSSHNPTISGSATAEKMRAVWSDLSDEVRMDTSLKFQAYQSPQEVAEKKIAESESLLRRLLREEERQFGPSARETCRRIYELARFLHSHQKYEEVETLSRRAIAGFKDLGLIGDWLDSQCFLGDSLQLQDLDDGATHVLLSAIARSLISNAHNQLRCAMLSLQGSHGKPKHRGRFNQAISIIFQMEKIVLSPKPALGSVYGSDQELLFQGLMLAKTYSVMSEFEFAEIIFSTLMPEVNRIKDDTDKFFGYLWYGLHHQRLRNLPQADRNLTLAYQTLSQLDKIWFSGEKMKNPWKDRSAKAVLRLALSLPENNIISEALQKGWWDPETEVAWQWKIRPCATQLKSGEDDSSSEFEGGISHKYGVSIFWPRKVRGCERST